MAELQAKGYTEKEVLNLRLEVRKLNDIEFLKSQKFPGPFTNIVEVQLFMDGVPESKEKNERMYREVSFHGNSSTAMKRVAEMLFLRLKRAHKNLETIGYTTNLCQYLDQTKDISSISMGDLRNVLNGLNSIVEVDAISTDQSEATEEVSKEEEIAKYRRGKYVACVWADDAGSDINWHLQVVDRYDYDKNEHFLSYMKRTDAKGTQWLFQEEAQIHITPDEQVIKRNVSVRYSLNVITRCSLDKKQRQGIVECFQVLLTT